MQNLYGDIQRADGPDAPSTASIYDVMAPSKVSTLTLLDIVQLPLIKAMGPM